MNKRYDLIGNKAVVHDEKGFLEIVDNVDNINQILVQENIVNAIQDRINEIRLKFEHNVFYVEKENSQVLPFTAALGAASGALAICIIGKYGGDIFDIPQKCLIGASGLLAGIVIGAFMDWIRTKKKISSAVSCFDIIAELKILEIQLKYEEKLLRELQDSSFPVQSAKEEYDIVVDDEIYMKELKKRLEKISNGELEMNTEFGNLPLLDNPVMVKVDLQNNPQLPYLRSRRKA